MSRSDREAPHYDAFRARLAERGLELVADRATKEPFDPARRLHAAVKREAMARGLMCYPMGGTIDGVRGDHVLLAPPFIIEEKHALVGKRHLAGARMAAAANERRR